MKGGKDIRMCDSCGQWEERSVPRDENNHRFSNYSILTKATCKSEGVEVGHCLCGAEDRRSVPVDRKAHSYGEWLVEKEATCGSKGELRQTCAECGAFQTKRIPENGDHVLGKWETVIRPTCTDGEERCSCACGKRYETRVIPAKEDHRFGEWKTTLAPDVGVWGSEIRECVNCHETEKRAIAPLDPPDISDPSPDDPSDSEDQNGNNFGGLVSWLLGGATVGALAAVGIVAVGVTVVGATVGGVVLIIVRVIAKKKR